MTVLSAIVNGVEYSLDNGIYFYWVVDDGLGMAPLHRLTQRGPLQHGETDRGFRLDPRPLRLILDAIDDTQADWETSRLYLMSLFKPTSDPITLKFAMETRTYYLDVHCTGQPLSMPSADRLGWNQIAVVDFKAPDPTFYGSMEAVTFNLGGGASDAGAVPTSIPMFVSASTLNQTKFIEYSGSVLSYPIIRIYGPITDPVITNSSTNEKLDFTGTTIAANHHYEIDCRYGHKTVYDYDDTLGESTIAPPGTNVIDDLTSDSDLTSFHIGAYPEVGGTQFEGTSPIGTSYNSLTVTGSAITQATRVYINYYTRYIGI